jgi:hypothetical protein
MHYHSHYFDLEPAGDLHFRGANHDESDEDTILRVPWGQKTQLETIEGVTVLSFFLNFVALLSPVVVRFLFNSCVYNRCVRK